jgi:hypothetical protein
VCVSRGLQSTEREGGRREGESESRAECSVG